MPLTLDATVGGPAANSYVTLEEAAGYFDSCPPGYAAAWPADEEDRKRYLISAGRNLEKVRFHGERVYSSQRLAFPRDIQREPISQIPQAIKDAQCEEALSLVRAPQGSSRQRLRAEGVESYRIGDLAEKFGAEAGQGTQVSAVARGLLDPWIKSCGQVLGPEEDPCEGGDLWWGPFLR